MLNERFIELLTKKFSSELTAEESVEFRRILADNASCRLQYNSIKNYWQQKDDHYANSEAMLSKIKQRLGTVNTQPATIQPQAARIKKLYWLLRGIAAVVLLSLGAFGLLKVYVNRQGQQHPLADLQKTSAPLQQHSYITLTDGTRVTLNAESTLKYPASFDGATREVYLSGEAYFDVHKDHKHPFIIHTQKMNVRVLGTAFNVKAYPFDATTETTLIRGAIEVTLADRPSDRIILKPNEKLILQNKPERKNDAGSRKAEITPDSEPQYTLTTLSHFKANDTAVMETAWLKNRLLFRNEDFETLAERMHRWYGLNIVFQNSGLKEYRFNGVFEHETIVQALNALQMTEKFHYKIQNSNVYIY